MLFAVSKKVGKGLRISRGFFTGEGRVRSVVVLGFFFLGERLLLHFTTFTTTTATLYCFMSRQGATQHGLLVLFPCILCCFPFVFLFALGVFLVFFFFPCSCLMHLEYSLHGVATFEGCTLLRGSGFFAFLLPSSSSKHRSSSSNIPISFS